jgi:hypothetical protein
MIQQLLDRSFVLRHMKDFAGLLEKEIKLQQQGDRKALDRKSKTGVSVADLQETIKRLDQTNAAEAGTPNTDPVFLSRQEVTSAAQSALQRVMLERRTDLVNSPGALRPGSDPITDISVTDDGGSDDLFTRFGPADLGWASVLLALVVRGSRGPHPFNPNPAPLCRIANNARVILLADWGTGIPRARKVAAAARSFLEAADAQGVEVHVIHLGDVYYSGWESEYDEHFLPFWPVREDEAARFGSWNLNANHDMYSGGYGYFDHLLSQPQFSRQGKSSFFRLENDHWQILALDTAHKDFALQGNQAEWVAACRREAAGKKALLMSHHQPFSLYEETPPDIMDSLRNAKVFEGPPITGWFWGHEHRCVFYDSRDGIKYGRCVGHSGVPVFLTSAAAPRGVSYEFGDWLVGTMPKLARFGFVVLDFDGGRIHAQYLNEDSVPHNLEDLS